MVYCIRDVRLTVVHVVLLAAALGVAPARGDDALAAWTAAARPAVELYLDGHGPAAQQYATQLLRHQTDPAVRREALAVVALVALRDEGRADITNARAQLRELGQADPGLLERPEVLLAWGVGQRRLHETSAALDLLNQAAVRFARRGAPARQAVALAELAEAWRLHAEWDTTPILRAPRPDGAAEAHALRLEQIRALRDEVALLEQPAALARIELTLAETLLAREETAAEGRAALEAMAGGALTGPTAADAALRLAALHEEAGDRGAALALYERVAGGATGAAAARAAELLAAGRRPMIELAVPATARPGVAVPLGLRTRGVRNVVLEVRGVELAALLGERQGRLTARDLPVSGTLRAQRTYDTSGAAAHAWWSPAAADVLAPELPAGAYVVVARGTGGDGGELVERHLLIVSDIRAALVAGGTHAVLWVWNADGTAAAGAARARFWMHGSFVPTEVAVADGVARFALPGEARVFQDKRWVCLVELDGQLALCAGRLRPRSVDPGRPTEVLLVGDATAARPGTVLRLSGQLRTSTGAAVHIEPGRAVLELRNAMDEAVFAQVLTPDAAGVFEVDVQVTEALAGLVLRGVVLYGADVLPNVRDRLSVTMGALDETPLALRCDVAPYLADDAAAITGTLTARYPWGSPLGEQHATAGIRAVQLPDTATNRGAVARDIMSTHAHLCTDGSGPFAMELEHFALDEGPVAFGVFAEASGWDKRLARATGAALRGADGPVGWLLHSPAEPKAGDAVTLELGWYDPTRQTRFRAGVLKVEHGDGGPDLLPVRATPAGPISDLWFPPAAGTYEVGALLETGGEPLSVAKTLVVAAGGKQRDDAPIGVAAKAAKRDGRSGVVVWLQGRSDRPVLAVLRTTEPLAAVVVPPWDRFAEVFVPTDEALRSGASVVVLAGGTDGLVVRGEGRVEPPTGAPLLLSPMEALAMTEVTIDGDELPDSAIVRLVATDSVGEIAWLPVAEPYAALDATTILHVGTSETLPAGLGAAADAVIRPAAGVGPAAFEALYHGRTVWQSTGAAAGGAAGWRVPLPAAAGLYELRVWYVDEGGWERTARADVRVRPVVTADVDLPGRLSVGDRTVAAVRVRNGRAEAVDVAVRLDWSSAIAIEAVQRLGGGAETLAGRSVGLSVAAGEEVTLLARVEAARPGPARLTAIVQDADGERTTTVLGEVLEETAPDGAAPVRVRRTVELLTPAPALPGDQLIGPEPPRHERVVLEPGAAVEPGQMLLVTDEVVVPEALERVGWRQRLPANAFTALREPLTPTVLGRLEARALDELRYGADRLMAGRYRHEWVIVAARPGVCELPRPGVSVDGAAVGVELATEHARLVVREP